MYADAARCWIRPGDAMSAESYHGSLGSNVKAHFAGAEGVDRAIIANDAGVKYFLFTVLPFIMKQFDVKWGYITNARHLKPQAELPKFSRHIIMDSGLFSLMFGACKDVHPDESFIRRYKDAICNFVHENKAYGLTCVECDCQKLLGVDLAWQLREQMRNQIPNRIINVFHYEDGKKGLDRMIEFSNYIAISVPELRIVKPKTYKEDTYRLASYIKEKKPGIDIHLLGGTEFEMLRRCKFCTSADSTSWATANRFGTIMGKHVNSLRPEKMAELREHITQLLVSMDIEPKENRVRDFTYSWLSAYLHRQQYIKYAGNQD